MIIKMQPQLLFLLLFFAMGPITKEEKNARRREWRANMSQGDRATLLEREHQRAAVRQGNLSTQQLAARNLERREARTNMPVGVRAYLLESEQRRMSQLRANISTEQ